MNTPFSSPSSGNSVINDITDEVIENGGEKMPINVIVGFLI